MAPAQSATGPELRALASRVLDELRVGSLQGWFTSAQLSIEGALLLRDLFPRERRDELTRRCRTAQELVAALSAEEFDLLLCSAFPEQADLFRPPTLTQMVHDVAIARADAEDRQAVRDARVRLEPEPRERGGIHCRCSVESAADGQARRVLALDTMIVILPHQWEPLGKHLQALHHMAGAVLDAVRAVRRPVDGSG